MPLPKVIPALADLTQDIAGPIPVHLLRNWAAGEQDIEAATALLGEFEREGTVVCSDACGLSRMTQAMELLDVLNVVSQPKEIIYALGREIGGRGIGTWVADNTEMIYPSDLEPETVIAAMGEAQFRIQQSLQVRVGMCVHSGRFYEVGGGLYGADADLVEHLAENCSGPGEILLTTETTHRIRDAKLRDLEEKTFGAERAWSMRQLPRMPHLQQRETAYPHPFPDEFYRLLPQLTEPDTAAAVKEKIYSRWLRERFIVFLARTRDVAENRSLADLLDGLVINALMETVVKEKAPGADKIASSAGGIAILTFDTGAEALDFAQTVRVALADNGLSVRVGIDSGPVLLFQNVGGPGGITGDPVNIASKLSEDAGTPGCINVTERAARHLPNSVHGELFEIALSGVVFRGTRLA